MPALIGTAARFLAPYALSFLQDWGADKLDLLLQRTVGEFIGPEDEDEEEEIP